MVKNIKTTLKGKDLVNKKFVSKKGFPKGNGPATDVQYVKVGDLVEIVSYDENTKEYKLINEEFGPLGWFLVNYEELDYLLRRGNTK